MISQITRTLTLLQLVSTLSIRHYQPSEPHRSLLLKSPYELFMRSCCKRTETTGKTNTGAVLSENNTIPSYRQTLIKSATYTLSMSSCLPCAGPYSVSACTLITIRLGDTMTSFCTLRDSKTGGK